MSNWDKINNLPPDANDEWTAVVSASVDVTRRAGRLFTPRIHIYITQTHTHTCTQNTHTHYREWEYIYISSNFHLLDLDDGDKIGERKLVEAPRFDVFTVRKSIYSVISFYCSIYDRFLLLMFNLELDFGREKILTGWKARRNRLGLSFPLETGRTYKRLQRQNFSNYTCSHEISKTFKVQIKKKTWRRWRENFIFSQVFRPS